MKVETSNFLITLLLHKLLFDKRGKVLEPSAGDGKLAEALRKTGHTVECVELNHALAGILQTKGFTTYNCDFLNENLLLFPPKDYDYVVAVPPYKDNVDCLHIMKMYEHVRTGGRVISLTLPHWTTGFFQVQRDFRKWLSDKKHYMEIIVDEEKSYFDCPKAILVIEK